MRQIYIFLDYFSNVSILHSLWHRQVTITAGLMAGDLKVKSKKKLTFPKLSNPGNEYPTINKLNVSTL